MSWDLSIGVSGTCRAIAEILQANGWGDGSIDGAGLDRLKGALLDAGGDDGLTIAGIGEDRRPVLAAGLAILRSVFVELEVDRMEVADGALREGLLYDLIGRDQREDVRHTSVDAMQGRFDVDREQAGRVAKTARALATTLGWEASDGFDPMCYLRWAAQLHELGLCVAFTGYHRHGAYLIENASIPGFSRDDTHLLALLIDGHRRKLRPQDFLELSTVHDRWALPLCVVLRLSVLLNRSRTLQSVPGIRADFEEKEIRLEFDEGWMEQHPLTWSDLEEERGYLEAVGLRLNY
jgi:exopolyphosphatase/guanosine-5'-triphosphate,3'-diphosphate pyrophosphatase